MALALIPDVEGAVANYLRAVPELAALSAKVATKSLGDSTYPWIRVTLLDSPRIGPVDHLIEHYFAIDVFAAKEVRDGVIQVNDIQRTVRAALNEMQNLDFDDVVVTGVDVGGGRLPPDDSVTPARERHQLTATVYAHAR